MVGIIIPILDMEKLRHRVVNHLLRSHSKVSAGTGTTEP